MRRAPPYCYWKRGRRPGDPGYWYFDKPGFARQRLPGLPFSPTFMAALEAAENGAPRQLGADRVQQGTLADLIAKYYVSPAFTTLEPSTKTVYRRIIEKIRAAHGSKPIKLLTTRDFRQLASRIEKPAAQKRFISIFRIVLEHGVDCGMLESNPAANVKGPKLKTKGFHTWTEGEIAQFEAKHEIGTRERLALALMLYTGQRRSDAVRMGRQHVRDERIKVTQKKTKAELCIPVHPELAAIIEASGNGHMTFLVTSCGKPFTAAGFGNWFREVCNEAGLPHCTAHGLRNAAARRLAEAGATPRYHRP